MRSLICLSEAQGQGDGSIPGTRSGEVIDATPAIGYFCSIINPLIRVFALLIGLSALLLAGGCGSEEATSKTTATNHSKPVVQADPAANPPAGMKRCFQCNGAGKMRCPARGCVGGTVECPNTCLKLTRGVWAPLPGYPPDQLFQKFPAGKGGYQAWSQSHIGQVIKIQNGQAVNLGVCTLCAGSTRIKCSQCGGTGIATCSLCKGKFFIPEDWTPLRNPTLAPSDSLKEIKFKDGRTIMGKIQMRSGSTVIIRTEEGQMKIDASELAE